MTPHPSRGPETPSVAARAPYQQALGWKVDSVTFRYPAGQSATLAGLSLEIAAGTCTAILGPNGSGKSTLLRLLLGTLRPNEGSISLAGRPLHAWSRGELARSIGVVTQNEAISFPLSVRELVTMGRYPHLGLLRPVRGTDRNAIERAMERCDVADLQHREIDTLSGGERQRARLARALAQEPRVLALDEPTRALDVRHEMQIFELVRTLVADGVTVALVTHNVNLAARYADAIVLLDEGRLVGLGQPAAVLSRELLESVFRWPLATTRHPGPGRDIGAIQFTPLASPADPARGVATGKPPEG